MPPIYLLAGLCVGNRGLSLFSVTTHTSGSHLNHTMSLAWTTPVSLIWTTPVSLTWTPQCSGSDLNSEQWSPNNNQPPQWVSLARTTPLSSKNNQPPTELILNYNSKVHPRQGPRKVHSFTSQFDLDYSRSVKSDKREIQELHMKHNRPKNWT